MTTTEAVETAPETQAAADADKGRHHPRWCRRPGLRHVASVKRQNAKREDANKLDEGYPCVCGGGLDPAQPPLRKLLRIRTRRRNGRYIASTNLPGNQWAKTKPYIGRGRAEDALKDWFRANIPALLREWSKDAPAEAPAEEAA